ncbi:MAG TPA: DegT/DnrJ/EryC1/StrS family aminotransferase [Vicinamibacterales bacterium]|jgi:dTDP-4-amino-4,6-dideoxygalactose transaminase|nr:DegT/DnrJ/EryC1/StrS family aminotransferase [Vicinamibacterales bacterium]
MNIPLVDLHAQHSAVASEIQDAIARVFADGAFVGGQEPRLFERAFAQFLTDASEPPASGPASPELHCASCGSGTDALYLTLRALGIGRDDEVVTVAHTFVATAEAISLTGARPTFVDIAPDTLLMDPNALEAAITKKTRAIVPVHLYGQPCNMDRIMAVARRYGLKVVEDAAQAHGARWRGQSVGTIADAGCFSFYPSKNLGACGDAGAVVSRDLALIDRVAHLANHGSGERYLHETEGVNSRLDAIQAAILRVKLRHLSSWNALRQRHAALFLDRLRDSGIGLPVSHPLAEPVWHLFVVRLEMRELAQDHLRRNGIATGIHYPVPIHLQRAYRHLGIPTGSLPFTERAATEVLSLPMYPELTANHVNTVSAALISSPAGRRMYQSR